MVRIVDLACTFDSTGRVIAYQVTSLVAFAFLAASFLAAFRVASGHSEPEEVEHSNHRESCSYHQLLQMRMRQ